MRQRPMLSKILPTFLGRHLGMHALQRGPDFSVRYGLNSVDLEKKMIRFDTIYAFSNPNNQYKKPITKTTIASSLVPIFLPSSQQSIYTLVVRWQRLERTIGR